MPTFLYWRSTKTGEIYAVRITDDGILDGAAGPIPPSEATRVQLPHWEFTPDEGKQLRERFLEFERFSVRR